MKALLSLALIAGLSICAQCLDLTLNDGRTYPDVKITNRTPDGIDIVSHTDMDLLVCRHIRYNELSQSSLTNFPDYDKPKADDYLTSARASHEKAIVKNNGLYTQWTGNNAAGTPVVYPVPSASSMRVIFKATKDLENGTIGWASTEDDADTVRHFGKIYIQGLKITDGNEWVGDVFITNKFMVDRNETCPCYATSKATASKIDQRSK